MERKNGNERSDSRRVREFLLRCLRSSADGTPEERLAPPAGFTPGDWAAFFDEAYRQDVAPLIHRRLAALVPAESVPDPISRRFRAEYFRTSAVNMRFYADLRAVLLAFRAAGIPSVVLKGAYLAEAVYRDIGARAMQDVDLLVRKSDLEAVHSILTRAGFATWEYTRTIDRDDLSEWRYQHRTTRSLFEIHWNILSEGLPFRVDLDELWRASVPARLAGVETQVFMPADQVIHLCAHAATHLYNMGLRVLTDIDFIARRLQDGLDWEKVQERALRWRTARCTYLTLRLARELLQSPIPDGLLRALAPDGDASAYLEAAKDVIFSGRAGKADRPALDPRIACFLGIESRKGRLLHFLRRAFPPPKVMAAAYPVNPRSPAVLAFYPHWIWVLVRLHAGSVWGLLLGRWRSPRRTQGGKKPWTLMNWLISS